VVTFFKKGLEIHIYCKEKTGNLGVEPVKGKQKKHQPRGLLIPGWWFQPISKIVYSQNGKLPQIGMKIKKFLKPPPVVYNS